MKTLMSVLVVLIGLLSFSKPMEAQSFQPVFASVNIQFSGSPSVEYQYYQVFLRVTTLDGHFPNVQDPAIDLIPPNALYNPIIFNGQLQVWFPVAIPMNYYRVGVTVVGVDFSGEQTILRTRSSEWCDLSDLMSGVSIEL